MRIFYDFCLLLLGLISLPKWLWQFSKYRNTARQHLGLDLPQAKEPSIWIHMVSVGEVRAIIPLYKRLRQAYPNREIFLSTITSTGLAEAKRCFPTASAIFILPLDFSWNMKRLVKRLQPTLLILSEGDLWLNMLAYTKKAGARIAVVSAKLSARSAKRYALVPFFSKALFGSIDLICAQNETYAERLRAFSPHVKTTGNLKFDIHPPQLTSEEKSSWQKKLGIEPGEQVVVLGSTHPGEEEILLAAAQKNPALKILLVPRHPERFDRVFAALPPNSGRLTMGTSGKIVLIDEMGLLTTCYQLATLAIVGGSFVSGIGGHNVLEPAQAHIPVIFGPYMETQTELAELVLSAKAGLQVTPEKLPEALDSILDNPLPYASNAAELARSCRGATERTWNALFINH